MILCFRTAGGMVMCAYHIAVNSPQTFKGTLTIPLVSVSFLSVGGAKNKTMKELEKILKDLQKRGYEQVTIQQVIQWMSDIRRENKAKRIERRQNER